MEKIFVKPLKRHGSLWIYQNEILSDITHINAGSLVKVFEEKTNKIIGTGYINPQSVIAVRLLSFGDEQINKNFLRERIQKSHKYRRLFGFKEESYRLIFSESDFLPGLIVDKYGKCLVIQILTAGMERLKDLIVEILDKLLVPEVIILRNDAQPRVKEGLKVEKMVIKGCVDNLIMTKEDDLKFYFDPLHGQKTGFFLTSEKIDSILKAS